MPRKLTITVDAEVYDGLQCVIGRRRISRFLKAMADQITTASKRRLLRRLGTLGREDLDAMGRAVCLQLGL
jgi:mRNA-degrading endonuclease toxin of MazEF toxin-antitoxin module